MGRTCRGVSEATALSYVAGYTIGNDVSARDWQMRRGGGQWAKGKIFDTFAPLGPCIVTKEGIPDPQQLAVTLTRNGQKMQSGHTSQMIFGVSTLVSHLSSILTLQPGDLIFTGTPSGVGFSSPTDPQSIPPPASLSS